MDNTYTYTYFGIESNGEIGSTGLVGYERSIFDPEEITKALNIQPFRCHTKGDLMKNGTKFLFSSWYAEKSDINRMDVEAQCVETIKRLRNKIPALLEIKEMYNVNFVIMVVNHIFGEQKPLMSFNKDVIKFCYLTGTTIEVDMYLYPDDD
ncbi:MAG: DUF4279 domain-containing protein [Acidobacteriota bacterium]